MYLDPFIKMGYTPLNLVKVNTPLVGFTGVVVVSEEFMRMRVEFGTSSCIISLMVDLLMVNASSAYDVILVKKKYV
jgi:hypothetical protein